MEHGASNITDAKLPLPSLTLVEVGGGSFSVDEGSACACEASCSASDSASGEIAFLTDSALDRAVGVRLAFSTRSGGASAAPYESLNLGRFVGDDPLAVERNMQTLLAAAGMDGLYDTLVNPVQVHGTRVVDIESTPASPRFDDECDAVATELSHVPVMLCYADCVPVVLVSPTGRFSVVHSGWKGTYGGISGKALRYLCAASGADPSQVNVYIGPHIGQCCYEVDAELASRFAERFGTECVDVRNHLDLERCVMDSLLEAGANRSRIASASTCTACNTNRFYSHRAEGGATGRFCALCCRMQTGREVQPR